MTSELYLSDSQPGGGELREETAEDGGMKVHQQTSLSAERPTPSLAPVLHDWLALATAANYASTG